MLEHTLILGGAKSGKTALALKLVEASGLEPVYLATGQARDPEMARRIVAHQAERGPRWSTIEEPLDLLGALAAAARPDRALLVDCLTMWLTNHLLEPDADHEDIGRRGRELVRLIPTLPGPVVLVGNEVGLGIVPENALARAFRDLAGSLHQQLAAICPQVYLVAAGLPLILKGSMPPLGETA